MTQPTKIRQTDMDRAAIAAARAMKVAALNNVRIVLDLTAGRIEIIIGDAVPSPLSGPNPWDDE